MNYDFTDFDKKLKEIEAWLSKEFSGIRTGRASANLLDSVYVEAYGSKTPLNQVASVSSEDPKTLRVSVWDASVIKNIEKAITVADLGVSLVTDEKGIRVIFPELTSERRELLLKQINKKLEESRISVRNDREKIWNDIQKKVKDGELSEDDKFKLKEALQKKVDDAQERLEKLAEQKNQEIKL